jgi:hypothetical protein
MRLVSTRAETEMLVFGRVEALRYHTVLRHVFEPKIQCYEERNASYLRGDGRNHGTLRDYRQRDHMFIVIIASVDFER